MFEKFLSIFKYVLTDIAKIEIQLASFICTVFVVDKRIHHPKFDVFDVRSFEISHIQFTHDSTPTFLRIGEITVFIHSIHIKVIWSTFGREKRQIHHRKNGWIVGQITLIRENLLDKHITCVMVRLGRFIISEVHRRCTSGILRIQYLIHIIPGKQGTVFTIFGSSKFGFGEKRIFFRTIIRC